MQRKPVTVEPVTSGARLRALRNGKRLSQAELAERCDVSTKTIGAWEHDRNAPNRANRMSLAKALGTSEEALRRVLLLGEADAPAYQLGLTPGARKLSALTTVLAGQPDDVLVRICDVVEVLVARFGASKD